MEYEILSKMCMNDSTVESLIIALIGFLLSLKAYEACDERVSHVFDNKCFDLMWSRIRAHVQDLLNFMKCVWLRKVLTLVNELHVAESKKGHKSMIEGVRDFRSNYQQLLSPYQHIRIWRRLSKLVRMWERSMAKMLKN